jgi:orotate phosphoribosyltransferase
MSPTRSKISPRQRNTLIKLFQDCGAIHINRKHGIIVRGFALKPYYVEGMRISTSPEGLILVTKLMSDILRGIRFDVIAAPSISGIPYASILAAKFGKRLAIDRGTHSPYGMQRRLEGTIKKNDRIVAIDDIAKRGQTLIDVRDQVQPHGGRIIQALVVVDGTTDRERSRLHALRIPLQGLVTLDDLGLDPMLTFS